MMMQANIQQVTHYYTNRRKSRAVLKRYSIQEHNSNVWLEMWQKELETKDNEAVHVSK